MLSSFVVLLTLAGDPTSVHACGLSDVPDVLPHDPIVDCTPSTDTGYDKGTPFEITVVHIDDKPVEEDTLNAYWVMVQAAKNDGVDIHVVSGFRTNAEQQALYDCYTCCCCNNCNLAAVPGYSNHQSGHALDLNSSASGVYAWLAANAGTYGFTETVAGEPWHWEWWGGGPGGGICNITAGAVDDVGCTAVRGWAQDAAAPDAPVDVEVWFGGPKGEPTAASVTVAADDYREDLCMALGSCDHAFEAPVPLAFRDGQPHVVHVYAAGANGPNEIGTEVGWTCAAPSVPDGVRRAVPDDTLSAWTFDPVWDVAVVDAASLAALDAGPQLGAAPELVQVDGQPEVWLLDGTVRRHVPDPAAMAAWGFNAGSVTAIAGAELDAISEGTPLRPAPFLARTGWGEAVLIDDAQSEGGTTSSGTAGTSGTTSETSAGTTGDGSSTDSATGPQLPGGHGDEGGGCACATSGHGGAAAFAGFILLLGRRRRRST